MLENNGINVIIILKSRVLLRTRRNLLTYLTIFLDMSLIFLLNFNMGLANDDTLYDETRFNLDFLYYTEEFVTIIQIYTLPQQIQQLWDRFSYLQPSDSRGGTFCQRLLQKSLNSPAAKEVQPGWWRAATEVYSSVRSKRTLRPWSRS